MTAPPDPAKVLLEIVVPARNEVARLPAGLAQLSAKAASLPFPTAIIVVDSASTDGTADIVTRWPAGPVPVRLVSCDRRGKGAAVRAGILASTAPLVGFCDADMATDLGALDEAVSLLQAGRQVVIGSRAHPASDVEDRHSRFRRAGAAAFRALARVILPDVSDSQCGFKFFAGPVARSAASAMVTGGFAFDLELIARCQRLGAAPTEIPVRWRDEPGSTFSVARHSPGICLQVLSIWLRLQLPRPRLSARPVVADPLDVGITELSGSEPVPSP